MKFIYFNTKISNSHCRRSFEVFISKFLISTSTKPLLYFYPENFFINSNNNLKHKDNQEKWSNVPNSFKNVEILSTKNYPNLNIL